MSTVAEARRWARPRWTWTAEPLEQLRQNWLLVLAIGSTIWLILVPLAVLVLFSFRSGTPWSPGEFTFANYVTAYTNVQTYQMLGNTVVFATLSTALSLAIAVFFAYLTERTNMPFKNVAWGLMLVPMAVPGLLFGIAWTFLLSPRIGVFNVLMREGLAPLGITLVEGPLNLYSLGGLIFLDGLRGVTTIFLMIVGAFRVMDPSLEEAATMSGSSGWHTFRRVFIPILTPALFAAGMYSFMSSLESLEVPMIVGLPANIHVFSTYIFFSAQKFSPPQYGLSAALGATFLVTSVLLVFAYRRVVGRAEKFATITGKGYRPRAVDLGAWRYPAFATFVVYFLLTIGAPVLVLLWRSLHRFWVPPTLENLRAVSLRNYIEVFENPDVLKAIVNTLIVGVSAATITMLLSLVVAWVVIRGRFKGRIALDGLTFLPHAIPGVVVAIALIYLYLATPLSVLPIYGTVSVIIVGITIGYLAFGSRTMSGAMAQIHRELEEAATVSGAQWRQVLGRIVLPLLLPSFVSGWIWVAAHSLRSFSIPLLLSTDNSQVIAVIMWELWERGRAGPTAALGVMLILTLTTFTVAGRVLVTRLGARQQA